MKVCPNIPNQEFWQNKKVLVTGHTGFKVHGYVYGF